MGPFMTKLYPTNIRGTGQGFCYDAGRAIGSVFMTAIGFATAVMPLGSAIAVFSTLAHALMIGMLLLLPETRGRTIASLEPEAPGRSSPCPSCPAGTYTSTTPADRSGDATGASGRPTRCDARVQLDEEVMNM
jgi:hypothetical protein